MPRTLDITGEQYGRLTAIRFTRRVGASRYWLFQCACGKYKEAPLAQVRYGRTLSCGCLLDEQRERFGQSNVSHKMSKTATYKSWSQMIDRCTNDKCRIYPDYGGRGISVCERWRSFDNFYADMGDRPDQTSIDRIENNGNYEPGNCKWSTRTDQCNNRRSNKYYKYKGETATIAEFAVRHGIGKGTLWARVKSGWSIEDAIERPVNNGSNQYTAS